MKEQRQNKIVKPLRLRACLTRLSLPSFLLYTVQFVKPFRACIQDSGQSKIVLSFIIRIA